MKDFETAEVNIYTKYGPGFVEPSCMPFVNSSFIIDGLYCQVINFRFDYTSNKSEIMYSLS
jgi:hypothetical protein